MSMHRETYFTCTFASRHERRTAVIPAWDAAMAESLFRAVLDEEAAGPGTIEVEVPGGGVARRGRFAPSTGALPPP